MKHDSIEVSKWIFYAVPSIASFILSVIVICIKYLSTPFSLSNDDVFIIVPAIIPLFNIIYPIILFIWLFCLLCNYVGIKRRSYYKDSEGTYRFMIKGFKISVTQKEIQKKVAH